MSLLEIQDKTSKIERVNYPFPHAAGISNWLVLHELVQPRLKPSQQIVIFEERGEEIRMRRQHNLQNKIKEERGVRHSGTELRRRN
ncbi:hypothetical protein NC653_039650 [Populus alba x Populus x berolinensis]|uniref:Uncharacterized protein n=1 Tax=Populus alba x Populus x berolinensis TaxID=444605 RepID=A0AAD6LCF5_9ROSI|nr:hypothetical protein NC653_039650 [Populus alba x Populus x berolinensis]